MDNCWKKLEPVSNQRTTDVHRPFGRPESVPYAKHNVFTIQYPLVICDQDGMHKCIPYENWVNALITILHTNTVLHICQSVIQKRIDREIKTYYDSSRKMKKERRTRL